jgi:hypothetical protein
MATKLATYRIYAGLDSDNNPIWDTYYFATAAGQVGETSGLKFLRPETHTVNGKKFFENGGHKGIVLTGSDIAYIEGDTLTVTGAIGNNANEINNIKNGYLTKGEASTNYLTKDSASSTYYSKTSIDNNFYTQNYINNNFINKTSLGVANGVATLDASGQVPSSQLPSYVDDVVVGYYFPDTTKQFHEANNIGSSTIAPESGKIYVDINTNISYRWSGNSTTGYVEIGKGLALGETANTAYAGNKGKANAQAIADIQSGAIVVKKAEQDGDGNVIKDTYLPLNKDSTLLKALSVDSTNGAINFGGTKFTVANQRLRIIDDGSYPFVLQTMRQGAVRNYSFPEASPGSTVTLATVDQIHILTASETEPATKKSGDVWIEITG